MIDLKNEKAILWILKCTGYLFVVGVFFGSILPAMISINNSAVVCLGILLFILSILGSIKTVNMLISEFHTLKKG